MAGGVIDGRPLQADPARRRRRPLRRPGRARRRDVVRGRPRGRRELGSGVVMVVRRHRRPAGDPDADRRVLPRRVVRAVRPVPRRDRAPGGGARAPGQRAPARHAGAGVRAARRDHRRRCATRRSAGSARRPPTRSSRRCASSTSSRREVSDEQEREPERPARAPSSSRSTARRSTAKEDATILEVARSRASRSRRCAGENAHAGQRVPRLRRRGRGRPRPRAVVRAQGRGRHGVADALGARATTAARWCSSSSPRRSTCRSTPNVARWIDEYERRSRALRPAGAAVRGRRARPPARRPPRAPDGRHAATVHQPVKVDNELYVRDYSQVHPLLQVRRGAAAPTRRTRSRSPSPGAGSTPASPPSSPSPLPDSACVYCGNCIGVCPTGALMFKTEYDMREAGTWDESRRP